MGMRLSCGGGLWNGAVTESVGSVGKRNGKYSEVAGMGPETVTWVSGTETEVVQFLRIEVTDGSVLVVACLSSSTS